MSKAQWDVWDSRFVLTLTGPTGRVARLRLPLGGLCDLLLLLYRSPNPRVVVWALEYWLRDVEPLRGAALTSPPPPPRPAAGRGGIPRDRKEQVPDDVLARFVIRALAPPAPVGWGRKRSLGSAVGAFLNGVLAAVGLRQRRAANGGKS